MTITVFGKLGMNNCYLFINLTGKMEIGAVFQRSDSLTTFLWSAVKYAFSVCLQNYGYGRKEFWVLIKMSKALNSFMEHAVWEGWNLKLSRL